VRGGGRGHGPRSAGGPGGAMASWDTASTGVTVDRLGRGVRAPTPTGEVTSDLFQWTIGTQLHFGRFAGRECARCVFRFGSAMLTPYAQYVRTFGGQTAGWRRLLVLDHFRISDLTGAATW
jgi:hypothetical protein